MVVYQALGPIRATWRQLTFCLRILADLVSDVTFHLLYFGRKKTLPPLNHKILLLSASQLAEKIRSRQISSEFLVRACIERIAEIQPVLNAVVDQRYDEALATAQKVDRDLAAMDSEPTGVHLAETTPFLGVPFSVKEGVRVQGLHQSYGLTARADYVAPSDSDMTRALRQAGAIPLCVSNVSELGLWWDSSNYVYGTSCNPYDTTRSPGGSSGGEAALQAACGIPISIGTDTGGSIRTPAAFCGLFGHKATPGLMCLRGADIVDPPASYVSQLQVAGPMSRNVEDLVPILRVLMGSKADKLRLDQEVYLTQLKFFYVDESIGSNLVSPVAPEVRQALFRVIDFLEDNFGVQVQRLKLPRFRQSISIFTHALVQDSCESPLSICQSLSNNQGSISIVKEWSRWIIGRGGHIFPNLVNASMNRVSQGMLWTTSLMPLRSKKGDPQGTSNRDSLKRELMDILGTNGVLLCPAHPTTAPYHFQSYSKPFNFIYSGIFNALGFPATTVPLGLNSENLPLSIQVVAGPFNDRLTLAVANALERPFGGWIPPFRDTSNLFY
ncbi:fatty-acid amide hydrolase 2-like [Tigriopus californicus]|uniref:fatty-acid amide hydrolase 2-like n=1 Tax=Tigriopus californicus TaxID=6832 RepID=UPI0027D9CF42|nr:fatty-acid amide hydrolase 2-like [Tigriopus californicus]